MHFFIFMKAGKKVNESQTYDIPSLMIDIGDNY